MRLVLQDCLVVLDSEGLTRDHGTRLAPGLPASHLASSWISRPLLVLGLLLADDSSCQSGGTAQRTGCRRDLSVRHSDKRLTIAIIDHVLEGCLATG